MNSLKLVWHPSDSWSGTCMIDQQGNVYPCHPYEHTDVTDKAIGLTSWNACRLGWVRIGISHVQSCKRLTDEQHDAIMTLFGLISHGKLIGQMGNCLLRLLSGEVGEFYEND